MKFSIPIPTAAALSFPICITMAFATASRADAATWTGSISQDWHTSGNWSPATVPASGNDVIINNGVSNLGIGTIFLNLNKLQVANTGTATLNISGFRSLTTASATIGNQAGGRGIITVSVPEPTGSRTSWSNNGDILVGNTGTGTLEVRNGARVQTNGITVATGSNLLSISGYHTSQGPANLTATSLATINGRLEVTNGGLFSPNSLNLQGSAVVSGAHASGTPAVLSSSNSLNVGGSLEILDGGNAYSNSATVSGEVTISGVSSTRNIRSSWRTKIWSTDIGTQPTKLDILDGGLLTSNAFSLSKQVHPATPSIVQVSGVSSSGISSTLSVGSLSMDYAELSVTDGGTVEAGSISISYGGYGSIEVIGASSGGKSSSVITNGRIRLQSGSFAVRHGALVETHGFDGQATRASVIIQDSTVRSGKSGSLFRGFSSGRVQLYGEASFDTQGYHNTIDNTLKGTGGLTKLGTGKLELTVASNYEGNTHVLDGILVLNNEKGSATGGGDVYVAAPGSIGGSGAISGSLFNGGTVRPGNSPGTLTIGGDYQQDSSGKLVIQVASSKNFDVLSVGGDVTLGGTLQIESNKALKLGQQFAFIQAEGEINGGFDSVVISAPGNTRGRFISSGGTGAFSVAPLIYSYAASGHNELSLARALNNWIDDTTGDTLTVVENLDQLTAAGYQAAFADISPALYGAVVGTGIEQSQSQSNSLVQFLNSRRLGQSPLGEDGKEWEAWALSTGVYSPGSMSSLDGSEFTSGNFLSGIERRIDSTFTAGIFASTGDSRGEFAGSSLIKQDRFTFGGYATARRDGYYATTALGGGVLEAHVTRDIEFAGLSREAHSHTDGSEFFSLLAGGYDFRHSNWTFGPTASLQYSKVRYDDVKEKGAGALDLAVGNPEDDSLRSLIGGRVAYHHKASETLTLVPEARVSWQHEFFRNNGTLDAALQQGAGPGFSHQLADSDGDSVTAGLALGFQTLIGFYGNVSYDVEIGRESEVNQTLSVGADWKF